MWIHSDLHLGYATTNTEVQDVIKTKKNQTFGLEFSMAKRSWWRRVWENLTLCKWLPRSCKSDAFFYIFWLRMINRNGIRSSWLCGSSIKNFVECKADQWGGWREIVGEQFPSFYNPDWIWIRVTCETGIQWTQVLSSVIPLRSGPVSIFFWAHINNQNRPLCRARRVVHIYWKSSSMNTDEWPSNTHLSWNILKQMGLIQCAWCIFFQDKCALIGHLPIWRYSLNLIFI